MKSLFGVLLATLFLSVPAFALQWEIVGEKSKQPVYRGNLDADLRKSAGEITVQILEQNHIAYIGNESAITSILGTPTGNDAIVVAGDTTRAYGWCFEVDGVQPNLTPDKFLFSRQQSVLRWYFAFALNQHGEWKSFCVPAYTNPLNASPRGFRDELPERDLRRGL